MAITSARMQVRRGLEKDFDPDKMTPGEWALSTDTKYIRMCIYPGFCLRMATYESFEQDMEQIQTILTEARTIQEAVTRINTEVSANAKAVAEYTSQAKQYRDEAENFKNQASAIVGVDIATEDVFGLMAGGDNAVENGILTLTKTTKARTLLKSHAGGLKINSIEGESQQDGTPSPDAEAKIKSVKVGAIKGVGKNLWNVDKDSITVSANTSYSTPLGSVNLKKSETITVSCKQSVSLTSCLRNTFAYYLNGISKYQTTSENYSLSSGIKKWTFTAPEDGTYNLFYWCNNPSATVTYSDFQAEYGSTVTDYEPYHEKSIQLSAPITLRGIGDVKDVVDVTSGKELQNIYNFKINNSTYFAKDSASTDDFFVASFEPPMQSGKTGVRVLSTHFSQIEVGMRGKTTGLYAYLSPSYTSFSISIPMSIANDVATLKTWLMKKNVEFSYAMNEPIETDLPVADQIALHQLETFDTVTYISTDSEIEPVIEVEYGTSKVGAYAIKGMNTAEANALQIAQLNTLTNELATQLVAGSEV